MSEEFKFAEKFKESVEQKKERLMPVFTKSFEVMQNPEMDLEEGILVVTRERENGKREVIKDLMVMEINDDGPNLALIYPDGTPSASATMLWSELIDARKQGDI